MTWRGRWPRSVQHPPVRSIARLGRVAHDPIAESCERGGSTAPTANKKARRTDSSFDVRRRCHDAQARRPRKAGMLGVGQIYDTCIYSCSFQIHCIYRIQCPKPNTVNTYLTSRMPMARHACGCSGADRRPMRRTSCTGDFRFMYDPFTLKHHQAPLAHLVSGMGVH